MELRGYLREEAAVREELRELLHIEEEKNTELQSNQDETRQQLAHVQEELVERTAQLEDMQSRLACCDVLRVAEEAQVTLTPTCAI